MVAFKKRLSNMCILSTCCSCVKMGEEDEGIINHCMVDVANIDESSTR